MVSVLPLPNVDEQCDEPKCSKNRFLMAESLARTRSSRSFWHEVRIVLVLVPVLSETVLVLVIEKVH